MKKVGLIGESPNDTLAIINLLQRRYKDSAQFVILLKRITGHQLDAITKIVRLLKVELNPTIDFIIYIRDLDALQTNSNKLQERNNWFITLDKNTNKQGIFLLNIFELEALLLADISTFNKIYSTNINFKGNPMQQINPKEFLQQKTSKSKKRYVESAAPRIFSEIRIEALLKNCQYFRKFIRDLEEKL